MIGIEQAAANNWKGKIALTDAYPNLGTTSSNTSVVYGKGHKRVGGEKGYSPTPDEFKRQQRIDAMTPIQKKNALIEYGTFMNQKESEFLARKAAKTNETFIQDIRNKKGTITTDSAPTVIDDVDSWQDIGPAQNQTPTSINDAFPHMTADELGLPIHREAPYVDDLPGNVYEGGMTPTADELGLDADEIKAHNARVDAAKSAINSKKPTQLTEFDLIELKKSKVLSKESGTPTFTTKGEKVKTAVKKGASKLKGPGVKGVTKAILPAVGAAGLLVVPAVAEAALWGRNPTAWMRGKQYLREFLGNTKVASGIDEEPGYLNNLGIFGDYDPKKLRESGKRRKSGLTGKGNVSIINLLKPSTENAWKNRRGARRN
jgi:hypothetical protein